MYRTILLSILILTGCNEAINSMKSETNVQAYVSPTIYSKIDNRIEVECPVENTLVIVGFGQSNSANHGGHRFEAEGRKIYNLFDGRCYEAEDPLLGASGYYGSLWIPLAKNFSEENIVIATFGVGGTSISQWVDNSSLFPFYNENKIKIKRIYPNPDHIIWIQGESDRFSDPEVFKKNLKRFMLVVKKDFPLSNIWMTSTSYCHGSFNNQIVEMQNKVTQELNLGFAGSTDNFFEKKFRYDDCHFSEQGLLKISELIFESINKE